MEDNISELFIEDAYVNGNFHEDLENMRATQRYDSVTKVIHDSSIRYKGQVNDAEVVTDQKYRGN